jgi:hypothetical protein
MRSWAAASAAEAGIAGLEARGVLMSCAPNAPIGAEAPKDGACARGAVVLSGSANPTDRRSESASRRRSFR